MEHIHNKSKDAERRYLNSLHRKDADIMKRLQERMQEFFRKKSAFTKDLKKELKDIHKKQESYVKSLPKSKCLIYFSFNYLQVIRGYSTASFLKV